MYGDRYVSRGDRDLRVDYRQDSGESRIRFWWELAPPTPTPTLTATPRATVAPSLPSLVLMPASGPVSTTINVVGTGWPFSATVFVAVAEPSGPSAEALNAEQVAQVARQASAGAKATGFITDSAGRFEGSLSLPTGQGWESRTRALVVAYTGDFASTAVAQFAITAAPRPSIALDPSSGPVGTAITVRGFHWPDGVGIFIALTRSGGALSAVESGADGAAITPANGLFETTVTVPSGQGWEDEPEAIVVAYAADFEASAVAHFTIVPAPPTLVPAPSPTPDRPRIEVAPAQVAVGTTATVTGTGWPLETEVFLTLVKGADAENVARLAVADQGAAAVTDLAGSFVASIVLPEGQDWESEAGGLIVGYTADYKWARSAPFQVAAPSPQPSPAVLLTATATASTEDTLTSTPPITAATSAAPARETTQPRETPTDAETAALSPTAVQGEAVVPASTATSTPTPLPTDTPTPTSTATPLPTDTPTATSTATPLPTDTPTSTPHVPTTRRRHLDRHAAAD